MSLGFYVDMTRCIGCRTCQVACKDRHSLMQPGPRPRRVTTFETGSFPNVSLFHTTMSCNHCDDPACVKGCPTTAMHKAEDGTVVHDDTRCVLCRNCIASCPYGAPQFDDVRNMIVKCDGCKDLRDAGQEPNCVAACPMRAIEFGDIDELRAKHDGDLVNEIPALAPARYTHPNLLMKVPDAARDDSPHEVTL